MTALEMGEKGPGMPHLGHTLLPMASGNLGDGSDDFSRCSSSRCHNLGGDNGDGGLDARTAGHTCIVWGKEKMGSLRTFHVQFPLGHLFKQLPAATRVK